MLQRVPRNKVLETYRALASPHAVAVALALGLLLPSFGMRQLLPVTLAHAGESAIVPAAVDPDTEFDAIVDSINPTGSSGYSELRLFATSIAPFVTVITEDGETDSSEREPEPVRVTSDSEAWIDKLLQAHEVRSKRNKSQELRDRILDIFEKLGVRSRTRDIIIIAGQPDRPEPPAREPNVFLTIDANDGTLLRLGRRDLFSDGLDESTDHDYYPASLRRTVSKFMASRTPGSTILYADIPWGYVILELRGTSILRSTTWVSLVNFNLVQVHNADRLEGVPFEPVRSYRRRGSIFEDVQALEEARALKGKLAEKISGLTILDMMLWDHTLEMMLIDWPGGSIFHNTNRYYYLRKAVLASIGLTQSSLKPADQFIDNVLAEPPATKTSLLEDDLFSAVRKIELSCRHGNHAIMRSGGAFTRALAALLESTNLNLTARSQERLREHFRREFRPEFQWDLQSNPRLLSNLCPQDPVDRRKF